MRAVLWAFGVTLAACSGSVAPASKPEPSEPVGAPETEDVPKAVDADVKPAAGPIPAEEAAVTEPGVAMPTKKQALKAAKAVLKKGKLAQLAPILPLSDGRAAVLWRNFTSPAEASVELVVLAQTDGVWTADSHTTVTSASTPWIDDGPPPFAVTARSDDYDDDGEPEILVRVRAPEMCGGGGPNTITQMKIFDTTPSLDQVLATELAHMMDAYPEDGTRAMVTHEDVDADGHRDVKIVYVSKSEGVAETATNLWTYVPDTDAWILRKPEYERWGCGW